MGVLPAVSAGVSLIGGIANISAKNRAADAQRAAITSESLQRAQQQQANEAVLMAQQQLAQQNYNNGILARLAQFQQAEMSLQAQSETNKLAAQQQAYALQAGQLQQMLGAQQAGDQLQRQATNVQLDANAKRQQTAGEEGQLAEQISQVAGQVEQALTQEERKRRSLEAAGQLGTSSNRIARDRELTDRLASALSVGLNIDRQVLAREMQAMNEDDIITAAERLGLLDNAASLDSLMANLKLSDIQTNAGLDAVNRNLNQQQGAIDIARRQQLMMGQLDLQNAQDAYVAQDYSLGVQRALGQSAAAASQQNLQTTYRNTRGSSLMDWLNVGVNAYGAVSPLLSSGGGVARQAQAGWMPNGAYSSGLTDIELARVGAFPPTDISGGFTGGTAQLPGLR